jgi:hypothetical protein
MMEKNDIRLFVCGEGREPIVRNMRYVSEKRDKGSKSAPQTRKSIPTSLTGLDRFTGLHPGLKSWVASGKKIKSRRDGRK